MTPHREKSDAGVYDADEKVRDKAARDLEKSSQYRVVETTESAVGQSAADAQKAADAK